MNANETKKPTKARNRYWPVLDQLVVPEVADERCTERQGRDPLYLTHVPMATARGGCVPTAAAVVACRLDVACERQLGASVSWTFGSSAAGIVKASRKFCRLRARLNCE